MDPALPIPVMQRHDTVGDYWLGITKIKSPAFWPGFFLLRAVPDMPKATRR
tara:strand:- start:1015 stop:1167 length:153 start_codon:yes stop_codon:yes gene_type:complete